MRKIIIIIITKQKKSKVKNMENKLNRKENGRNDFFQNIAITPFLSSSIWLNI